MDAATPPYYLLDDGSQFLRRVKRTRSNDRLRNATGLPFLAKLVQYSRQLFERQLINK
jgi:hypothetical protein